MCIRDRYCKYVDEDYTDVIHVPINKSGSSTYNNAVMAQGMLREERPEHHLRIHLLDPHTYSMPFGWYVCEMARKLQNGAEISHVTVSYTHLDVYKRQGQDQVCPAAEMRPLCFICFRL